jgi:hypothetical protein
VAVARRGDIGSVPLVLRTALRALGTHQWVPFMALLVGISTSSCGVLHGSPWQVYMTAHMRGREAVRCGAGPRARGRRQIAGAVSRRLRGW